MRTAALAIGVLAASSGVLGRQLDSIYTGAVSGRRVVAVSVGSGDVETLVESLSAYADDNSTLLAYRDYLGASEVAPVAVYVDRELLLSTGSPSRSTSGRSIQEAIQQATRTTGGGVRVGATCRDGTGSSATGRGACSHHGGVRSWRYSRATTTRDRSAIIATICNDYRLVADDGDKCGDAGILVRVQNIDYPPLSPAPAPADSPAASGAPASPPSPPSISTGADRIPVAPLPPAASALQPPVLEDRSVQWTSRSGGGVGFSWSTSIRNPNAESVDAVLSIRLHDSAGTVLHAEEEPVALAPSLVTQVSGSDTVPEAGAAQADHWTFDVRLVDGNESSGSEVGTVERAPASADVSPEPIEGLRLVVDLQAERARITNTGGTIIDLEGWTLVSKVGGQRLTFVYARVFPGYTLAVTSGSRARDDPGYYIWSRSDIWSDDGDPAELYDAAGRLRASTNADGSPRR